MIRFRKWNVYPPIFSNDGKIISELEITGKLLLNDNNDVFVNVPVENQILAWKVTQNADGSTDQRWENEDVSSVLPPVAGGLIDEIRMYGGDVTSNFPGGEGVGEYDGWYLCDGDNGTLDLRSRFVLGLGPGEFTDTIGFEGGVSEVQLTADESGMPAHYHDSGSLNITTSGSHNHSPGSCNNLVQGSNCPGEPIKMGSTDRNAKYTGWTNASHTHPDTSFAGNTGTHAGSGAAAFHTNIPPYTIVAYIQFKG